MPHPLQAVLKEISLKWAIDIMQALSDGRSHYVDIQHQITVSTGEIVYSKPLTAALRRLEDRGLVAHVLADDDGENYQLTASGAELAGLLNSLDGWRERHSPTPRR